jgi:glycosyltransferase involved in cell wall biosynthesis
MIAAKSSILRNVIDTEALYEKMKSDNNQYPYDVVFLGRLTYEKNPQRLINVFRLVTEQNNTVRFGIIGAGALENELKVLVENYGIEQNVTFLGFQENPTKMLYDSKVMVMTSRWEGTPMCALEAMALGVPIVSTPTDGLQEIIEHGVTGFLSDDDNELAEYILYLLQNNDMQKLFSERIYETAIKINDKSKYRENILKELIKL